MAYDHAPEEAEANSLVGAPEKIMSKLEALRRVGVEYVIMNCGGSREKAASMLGISMATLYRKIEPKGKK